MHRQAQNSPNSSVGTSININLSKPHCIKCKSGKCPADMVGLQQMELREMIKLAVKR